MLGVCNQVSLGSGQRPGYVVTIEGTDTHQAPEYPSVICTSVCVSTLQNPPPMLKRTEGDGVLLCQLMSHRRTALGPFVFSQTRQQASFFLKAAFLKMKVYSHLCA